MQSYKFVKLVKISLLLGLGLLGAGCSSEIKGTLEAPPLALLRLKNSQGKIDVFAPGQASLVLKRDKVILKAKNNEAVFQLPKSQEFLVPRSVNDIPQEGVPYVVQFNSKETGQPVDAELSLVKVFRGSRVETIKAHCDNQYGSPSSETYRWFQWLDVSYDRFEVQITLTLFGTKFMGQFSGRDSVDVETGTRIATPCAPVL